MQTFILKFWLNMFLKLIRCLVRGGNSSKTMTPSIHIELRKIYSGRLSNSPDLNPIENLKNNVEKWTPKNCGELKQFMEEEWQNIPQATLIKFNYYSINYAV